MLLMATSTGNPHRETSRWSKGARKEVELLFSKRNGLTQLEGLAEKGEQEMRGREWGA